MATTIGSTIQLRRILSAFVLLMTGFVSAEETEPEGVAHDGFFAHALDAVVHGDPILDVRFRWEHARIDGFQTSHALTARTRLGYQTKPLHGVSGLLEFVNVSTPLGSAFFDGVEGNQSGQTIVADPEVTQANRFWLNLEREDWLGSALEVGRQRIQLDDDRWVGNVGWRQIEQTFDAVRFQSSLGIDGLLVQYIYTWGVNRIFGDQGPDPMRDFGQDSHFLNLRWAAAPWLTGTAFAYLIDANDPFAANSSNTFGARFTGNLKLGERLSSSYQASYAYQVDGADNPIDYGAHYLHVEVGLRLESIGGLAFGYEMLGSDGGEAQIVTPFATAHRFNGFADAFLDNGGARGLRDLYMSIALAIPIQGLKMDVTVHQFYDDTGGDDLGQEYDLVTSYPLNQHITLLYKFAYYDEGGRRSPQSRIRNVLEATLRF